MLRDGNRRVRFVGATAEEAIGAFGRLPLPPYITRDPTDADEQRYQTVYARAEGSVAAPTAGLHFTPELLDALSAKGVVVSGLDLQVGPGTFKPVEADDPAAASDAPRALRDLARGSPRWSSSSASRAAASGRSGTTVVRALESAADPDGSVRAGAGETSLMITPGYRVPGGGPAAHQLPPAPLHPAHAGERLRRTRARDGGLRATPSRERYRFYSYGDAMVILYRWLTWPALMRPTRSNHLS